MTPPTPATALHCAACDGIAGVDTNGFCIPCEGIAAGPAGLDARRLLDAMTTDAGLGVLQRFAAGKATTGDLRDVFAAEYARLALAAEPPALDVERLARAQMLAGIDTFRPRDDKWVSANDAQAAIAAEYARLTREADR